MFSTSPTPPALPSAQSFLLSPYNLLFTPGDEARTLTLLSANVLNEESRLLLVVVEVVEVVEVVGVLDWQEDRGDLSWEAASATALAMDSRSSMKLR